MARAGARHAVWRELIAARLDRPLTRAETRALAAHLHDCTDCRQVDHDYRQERDLLRALPQPPAPRDLWPRTSAALDREVARRAYLGGRSWRGLLLDAGLPGAARRRSAPSAALVTTLAALGVIAVLGVMQLLPTLSEAPPTAPGHATPFAVAPQPLAFIGNEASDLYVYQTHVGHVCPQSAPDCEVDDGIIRTPVDLPTSVHARNVALSPTGHALALVGRDINRDLIAVVMLPNAGDSSAPAPGRSQKPDATQTHGSDRPSSIPASPVGSATVQLPSDEPPDEQSTTPPNGPATIPPASAVPGLRVLAILENVQSAGAPPAWSPSGTTLAFSAMPADGSHGPDVYVWAPSDPVARPITTDHGSYFASWSGEHIVFSRISAKDDAGTPRLSTVVIDPLTLEARTVAGPALWLPVVNPSGTHAVAWRGELDLANGLAVPQTGTLYLIRWDVLDPFAPGSEQQATQAPTEQPTNTPAASGSPPAPPTDTPATSSTPATPATTATATPTATSATTPSATAATAATATPAAATESPTATDSLASLAPPATEQATPPLPAGSVELDLGRDTTSAPVVDWQVRWSVDGQVLGIWIADAQGSTWGRLTVLAVDPDTQQVGNSEPLLSPTLARRGFSLGMSRVAWVAPSEDNPDGELRIRTWGDDGVGGLRLQQSKLEEVLPAF